MKNLGAYISLLGSFVSLSAFAGEINCADPQTTVEINHCFNLDYKAADVALNEVYQEAIISLNLTEKNDANSKGLVGDLRFAELKWIEGRDADCALVKRLWTGGSGGTAAYLGCMTLKTKERTQFLRDQLIPGC